MSQPLQAHTSTSTDTIKSVGPLLAPVGAYVATTVRSLRERSGALGALERFFPTMRAHVISHVGYMMGGVWAKDADKRFSSQASLLLAGSGAFDGAPIDRAKLAWSDPFGVTCLFATLPCGPKLQ